MGCVRRSRTERRQSLLPFSLSVEVHLWTEVKEVRWQGRWRRPEETAAWMETLRTIGYALVDRHDNPLCSYCSEITLARIAPPRNAAGAPARIPAALPAVLRDDLQTKIRISEPPWRLCGFPTLLLSALTRARFLARRTARSPQLTTVRARRRD